MSNSLSPTPIYTISVGTAGTFTDDSGSDISALVNAELAAAPASEHIDLIFNPGTYAETGPILIPSNTSVIGDDATLTYLSEPGGADNFGLISNADAYSIYTNTTLTTAAGNKVVLSTWPTTPTATGATPDVIDSNISVRGMTFVMGNALVFGTWFTNATDIDVQNNTYIGGVDANAFVNVTKSLVSQNIAIGQNNAAWDNWNGPTNITVELNANLASGTSSTGWSVLMNSTPTGDPSNPGNADNDGIVANIFASSLPDSTSVAAYALTVYGATIEYNITEQGNLDSMMSLPGETGIISSDPIFGLTVQDDLFSGIADTPDSGRFASAISVTQASDSAGGGNNDTVLVGNLVAGDGSGQNESGITNNGNSPLTVNNAIIGASSAADASISTGTSNGTILSQGNLSFYNGILSGSGIVPTFGITAPPVAFVPADIALGISGISIAEGVSESIVSVTLLTEFGSLSISDGTSNVSYVEINGETGIIINGSEKIVNQDLSDLIFTSNNEGWDDSIEVSATSLSGPTAVRYLPIVVESNSQAQSQIITLTPGEIATGPDPYTFASTVSLPNLLGDSVIASSGQNIISMNNSISVVLLSTGDDTVLGGINQGYIAAGVGDSLINLVDGGDVTVAGGAGATTIFASTGNNLLEGGVGSFVVNTGVGGNTVLGGLGDISVNSGSGSTLIETLPEDAGALNAVLGSGNTTVFALSGVANIITGMRSHDVIYLGIGTSSIYSAGQDVIFAGAGAAIVDASAGGGDTVYGGSGHLTFTGGSGSALVEPAQSSDLIAGSGNLTIGSQGSYALDLFADGITSRVVDLPSLSQGITLTDFPMDPIAIQYVDSKDILHAELSDGSAISIADPNRALFVDNLGSLQFIGNAETPGVVTIDVNSLPNFNDNGGANNSSIIEQALSSLPSEMRVFATLNSSPNDLVDGTLNLDPVVLTVDGALVGTGQINIDAESELVLSGSVASTETIGFENSGGSLILQDPEQFSGTLTEIGQNSFIDLTNLPFELTSTVTVSSDNVLTLVEGHTTISLQMEIGQSYSGTNFHIFSDGLDGTDVSERITPCLLRGTRVLTPRGIAFVETLKIGDSVLSEQGTSLRIKWIGHRIYAKPFPQISDVAPVRIKASALQDNVPDQDLLISSQHGIKFDRWIVPAGALINGTSILIAEDLDHLEYFHIETDSHEIIIAHNVPVETFIDSDSRALFDNAEEYYRLYQHEIITEELFCLPRLETGTMLESIRTTIALRAGLLPKNLQEAIIIGFLEIVNRDHIAGWVIDRRHPGCSLVVEILDGSAILARTTANLPRPDVLRAGYGRGYCGFSITLPAPLPALYRHEIGVRVKGTSLLLEGSPVIIDPALSHDLIRAEGLRAILEATQRSLTSDQDVSTFTNLLHAFSHRVATVTNVKGTNTKERAKRQSGIHTKATVLILDEFWPKPMSDAGSNAIMSHILAFQQLGCRVAFCATGGRPQTEADFGGYALLQQKGVECWGHDGMVAEDVIRRHSHTKLNFVYLHRLAVAASYGTLVRKLLPKAKIIYSLADLHHLRLSRQAELSDRPELRSRAQSVKDVETWAMRLSDCVISHSSFETGLIRAQLPRANVHLVPWSVDHLKKSSNFRTTKDVAFVGGAGHAPNVDAVQHLAECIMPRVWRTRPEIKCYIVGSGWGGPSTKRFDKRIMFLGQQADLNGFLTSVRLTLAPLRFGAGIKGKVLDSLACGTPCVMTSIAAEGIPLDAQLRQSVVDGAAFAEKVIEMYFKPKLWRILSQSGLDMIETYFSQNRVQEALSHATGISKMHSNRTRAN